jgi:hypothetical protein
VGEGVGGHCGVDCVDAWEDGKGGFVLERSEDTQYMHCLFFETWICAVGSEVVCIEDV